MRTRKLFARALDYRFDNEQLDYGLPIAPLKSDKYEPYLLFLHGTTWESKHWPDMYWAELTHLAHAEGFKIKSKPWIRQVKALQEIQMNQDSSH